MAEKYVYFFGDGKAEGKKEMKNELGGKGANLAEMTNIGMPVPPGFTISTNVCDLYYKNNRQYPKGLKEEVDENLKRVEKSTGMTFGDPDNPLLFSVRSGAAASMPGMMDTILNLGINEKVVEGIIKKSNNPRFAWDSYRRFIQMFSNVAMNCQHEDFEHVLDEAKKKKGVVNDTDLNADDLKAIVTEYKMVYKKQKGADFPDDPREQLWHAINAVFGSWMNDRAIAYRKIHDIKGLLGTAVNVQSMVFGNMGDSSATGVCFTRNPSTGDNHFYGEFLVNAQGEDVVAGIRTPQKMSLWESQNWANDNGISEDERKKKYPSLEEKMPDCYKQLCAVREKLEKYYKDMQDMEFTIQEGKLYMLQTRNGKRTGAAAVKIAVDMVEEGLIDKKTAVLRVEPMQLDQLLHPMFIPGQKRTVLAKGLNASPGASVGKAVFTAEEAEKMGEDGEKVILVRIETSPEDIKGMNAATGILTARGGATSHAAVVARQMGKPCVAGCGQIIIDYKKKEFKSPNGNIIKQGDWFSIDGTTGEVIKEKLETQDPQLAGDFGKFMKWIDEFIKMKVRANADKPKEAKLARELGAVGIGLCRTEHMFFEEDRILSMRKMIVAENESDRRKALAELQPIQKGDFVGIFKEMADCPVIIRLLDPPLHEFLPHEEKEQKELAKSLGVDVTVIQQKIHELHEFNPMLGLRGVRLTIVYPEIAEMQINAIVDAAIEVKKQGINVIPEIMIPLAGKKYELQLMIDLAKKIIDDKLKAANIDLHILLGTMIEVPRAALTADEIAQIADFFSFGTNDLTQMTCGFSRDDAGKFLKVYVDKNIYEKDPFQVLDQEGVGKLVDMAIKLGRTTNKNLEIGICGEHGGEPNTVKFCAKVGMNYVSCSPFRVPIAKLASAQFELEK
ncbi:MAG: pyruvate, phosphate dikinase [Spirochaetes bacterium]|nr:pyruvate, phosphate dikinase [Spirochaetota bacterium]